MRDVCFIADVAVLPRWMRVWQALDYVAGVHPRFDRAKAEAFLARTQIKKTSKVRELSKGMVTQLHLALVMAIDAKLLVLDEPTLGLDLLYRKQFYDTLLNDYFDHSRTIVVTTHQVEEIQQILTDMMFINRGRIVLDCSMEDFEARYRRTDRASGERRRRARAEADPRAPGARPQHHAVRPRRPRKARRAWRGPHAEHRRSFRGHDDRENRPGSRRMSIASQSATVRSGRPARQAAQSPTRPFYWSVRRELWEHRSVYLAPLIAAGLVLFGFLIRIVHLPQIVRSAASAPPDRADAQDRRALRHRRRSPSPVRR